MPEITGTFKDYRAIIDQRLLDPLVVLSYLVRVDVSFRPIDLEDVGVRRFNFADGPWALPPVEIY